jgi:protein-tyrosine phosphatase
MQLMNIFKNRLFVSGVIDDWTPIREGQIDTIVDLDGDVDKGVPEEPNRILYVYFPIGDETTLPNLDKLHALSTMVARLVETDHRVLVHCLWGLNRSCLVAGTVLTHLGMDGRQALEHLQQLNSAALYNPVFEDFLRRLPARPERPPPLP